MRYHLGREEVEELVRELACKGLGGVEAIHSGNEPGDEEFVKGLAEKYNLLISGGSDFRGTPKPDIKIGVGKGELEVWRRHFYELVPSIRFSDQKFL